MTHEEIIRRLADIQYQIESNESTSTVLDEIGVLIQDIEDGSELLDNMEFA